MERRWVSVGHTTIKGNGGLWILEYETPMWGIKEPQNLLPGDVGKVLLAKTMAEKYEILEDSGAKCFTDVVEYNGPACLRDWERKTEGELGELVLTKFKEEDSRVPSESSILQQLNKTPYYDAGEVSCQITVLVRLTCRKL